MLDFKGLKERAVLQHARIESIDPRMEKLLKGPDCLDRTVLAEAASAHYGNDTGTTMQTVWEKYKIKLLAFNQRHYVLADGIERLQICLEQAESVMQAQSADLVGIKNKFQNSASCVALTAAYKKAGIAIPEPDADIIEFCASIMPEPNTPLSIKGAQRIYDEIYYRRLDCFLEFGKVALDRMDAHLGGFHYFPDLSDRELIGQIYPHLNSWGMLTDMAANFTQDVLKFLEVVQTHHSADRDGEHPAVS